MKGTKLILVAFLAALAACFTIELPFTQVNYIHLLVNKKERGITNSLKDTHRLHKTYYEDPCNILPATPLRIAPPPAPEDYKPTDHNIAHYPPKTLTRPNTLRGPPSLS